VIRGEAPAGLVSFSGASADARAQAACYDVLVALPAHLVETLVCPRCKGPLLYFRRGEADEREADAFLLCPGSALRFAIEDDVANLILDEATALTAPEVTRLVARGRQLGLAVGGAP